MTERKRSEIVISQTSSIQIKMKSFQCTSQTSYHKHTTGMTKINRYHDKAVKDIQNQVVQTKIK